MTEPSCEELERERDLWKARYEWIMAWVVWLREDVCHFSDRPRNWQGLNRSVGTEDLFMASKEIEAEVRGDKLTQARLAASKDEQFRGLALQAAEEATAFGKPQGKDAPDV